MSPGTRPLAASLGAREVAGHQDTGYQDAGQGAPPRPPKLLTGAPSKLAEPAAGSARPSARSPPWVRSPLSLKPRLCNLRGGETPPGAFLRGPGCSRSGTRSANSRSRARAPLTHTHQPAPERPSWRSPPGSPPRPPPLSPPYNPSSAARSGGYVIGDARPAPPLGPAPSPVDRGGGAGLVGGGLSARCRAPPEGRRPAPQGEGAGLRCRLRYGLSRALGGVRGRQRPLPGRALHLSGPPGPGKGHIRESVLRACEMQTIPRRRYSLGSSLRTGWSGRNAGQRLYLQNLPN